jgi:hypothetical protein
MDAMSTLVMVRHGQSQWNLENRFTGWIDVPLTDKGRAEAKEAGIAPEKYTFTRRDLREKTGFSQDFIKRYLRRLVELELVLVERRVGAGRHVYRLGSPEGERRLGHLTTPDELEEAVKSAAARCAVVQ